MAARQPDPFIEHLLELLQPLMRQLGPMQAKRMFGGYGLFYDGLMFGLIAGNQLYFKVDAQTEGEFAALRSTPFTYQSASRDTVMRSYLSAPPACFDSASEMSRWARLAIEATLRIANQPKAKRQPRPAK
jgi:DNA transformation protein